jgi:hypothetical protein
MKTTNTSLRTAVWAMSTSLALAGSVWAADKPADKPHIKINSKDIGGVVKSANGPEAGVWVIAETHDLPVRYIKIVVTDDQGRFVVPDLPKAKYDVWVRGYGLVDSDKVKSETGKLLSLTAKIAPDERAAAHYYPALYWYAMLKMPAADQFSGKGDMPPNIKNLPQWINMIGNNGCVGCHQLGQLSTRTIPAEFGTGADGWARRTQSGQGGEPMTAVAAGESGGEIYKYMGDWTDRIAKGELPFAKPERPQGLERNVVITLRDWMNEKQYLHDLISTDKRKPTVNAYGHLYGSMEYSSDNMPILDVVKNKTWTVKVAYTPGIPESLGAGHAAGKDPLQPSFYWGNEKIWDNHVNNHNSMLDGKGRLWMAAQGFDANNPDWCKKGSDLPAAKAFPIDKSNRRVTMYDPKTGKFENYLTCFQTHHLEFGFDKDNTLWMSGSPNVLAWINTRVLDETHDIKKAQGWTPFVLDIVGNGKRTDYVEPNQPIDPTKDKRINGSFYAVMPSPVDNSIWGVLREYPGRIIRVTPGANPVETALSEVYNVPMPGFGPRGGDIDGQGVVWVSLASGHLGSFDRRKCKGPLNGPKATGDQCPEGWSFYKLPGPNFVGGPEGGSAEQSYWTWVDQHNTFGLGKDVPVVTADLGDGLVAYKDGQMYRLRVPYPLGFYSKGLDGRIDDEKAGWKGRGLWQSNGDRTPWLIEGGKGSKPLAAHYQLRPDPLAD